MKNKDGKILIIDDDQDVLYTARMILKDHYGLVKTESTPNNIESEIMNSDYDVILLDMNFAYGATSGEEGIELLKKILNIKPNAKVLMNTAYGDIDLAVSAMKDGATDFLVKPWEKEKLISTVKTVYQLSRSEKEIKNLKTKQKILNKDQDRQYSKLLTQSPAMNKVLETIDKVSKTDADILILGENGTGKELVAREIHRKSNRSEETFINVDLGALPESLFESELFGHVKGAFTDAKESRPGRFELANLGTLFLDEIGNLTLPLQSKLLSALQNRQVVRVGSSVPISLDIRIISATNRFLDEMIDAGEFRQDLLYRLNTVEINLPPLRERPEDVSLLLKFFLKQYGNKYHKSGLKASSSTIRKLEKYYWPGNIREFQHAVERAIIMSNSSVLNPEDFLVSSPKTVPSKSSLKVEDLEKSAIVNALEKCHGNLTKAAVELGFGRSTLYRKINKYGL
ncbi:MAG: sigma-54 dependent transcriptional regulator [Bacteroidetes bacterium]|nr:sigma-54 dependent transcriptional regulator [Bacteroidota bacterium]